MKKSTSALNNTVHKQILHRGSCEKLHKKLRFPNRKILGRISRNFHEQMVQSFSVWKAVIVRLEIFKSTSRLFIDHSSRDLAQTTMEAKTSQNKRFNESHNGSAHVISICTSPSQPMQNKKVHHGGIIFIQRFLHEFSSS